MHGRRVMRGEAMTSERATRRGLGWGQSVGGLAAALLWCGAAATTTGCAPTSHTRTPRVVAPAGPVEAAAVSDEAFARSVHALLVDGAPTVQRQSLLAGVVRRQLAHAGDRLQARQRERGLASVVGALYLIRAGEFRPEMIDAQGDRALALALDVVGAGGDEGRALALYGLRRAVATPGSAAARDIDEHLGALGRWVTDLEGRRDVGPAEASGHDERRAAARALLEPTSEALSAATEAVGRWVDAGLVFQGQYQANPRAMRKRDEAVEAFRAASSGAATLAALYLRHGDAAGAVEAIATTSVQQVSPSGLVPRLAQAARAKGSAPWRELLEVFRQGEGRDPETGLDPALVQAATFGIAVEAYRRDRGSIDVAMHLAGTLAALGLAEVAPTVLVDAAQKHPDAGVIGPMLEAIARRAAAEEASDDPGSARRLFAEAAPVLAVADLPELRGQVRPSAARVRLLGAGVSARAGELVEAKQLLEASVRDEPTAEALRRLAEIEWALGDKVGAIARAEQLVASPEARRDRAVEAEARLWVADRRRDAGDRPRAREALLAALDAALDARKLARGGPALATAERLLARVLERLGDDAGAARATARAVTAARGDVRQLGATVLEGVARAYVARDLAGARAAAQHALGAALRDDELVYAGLWLSLLERELGARPDDTAARLLAGVERGHAWSGRLAAWAAGKLSDADLTAAARTPAQRTEAAFYRALGLRVGGKAEAATQALREVADAPVLDLVETQFARDLLAGVDRRLPGPLPAGIP